MIPITPQMRILVAVEPVDFRNGIDGLARLCQHKLHTDAFSGSVFVFRNRRATAIKVLVYDGPGFWRCQKRLSSGRFRWWPTRTPQPVGTIEAYQLQMLLWAGNFEAVQAPPVWRRVSPATPGGSR